MALGTPATGRLVDRFGTVVVLRTTGLGQLGYVFAASAVLNAAGVALLLRCAGAVHLPRREHPAPLTAVFRQPGTSRVLVAVLGWAPTLGGLEYAVIGWCAAEGRTSLAGVLSGVTAVEAVLGRLPSVGGFTRLIAETTRVATAGSIVEHLGAGGAALFGIGCALGVAAMPATTRAPAYDDLAAH